MTSAQDEANRGNERNTVVDAILNSKLPVHEKTSARVFVEVSTVTGAGSETVASVLRFVLFHIYQQPAILQRLRTELASAQQQHGASDTQLQVPDLRTLEQLPYLTAVLKEGMRLSPATAARMERVAKCDLVYSGKGEGNGKRAWRIPAGTAVGMTLVLMHMDEEYFPEPRAFKPERWIDAETRARAERAYAPFSKGTRGCLGLQ
jgi:cytochrome P450